MLTGLFWVGWGRASAQEPKPSNVLIVRVAGDENIVLRLRAELSSYRFRVIEQPAAGRRSKELAELAEERDAQAAIRAKPEAMAFDLWVRAGGRTSEELVSAGPGRNPEVLALRVTEAMRARGLALPPLAAAGSQSSLGAADSGRRGGPAADGSKRTGAADSSKPGVGADGRLGPATDTSKAGPAAIGSRRPGRMVGDASAPGSEPDDPGVAEPTTPPPAATPIIPRGKTGDRPAMPARAAGEAPTPDAASADQKAADTAARKAAEDAERKAAEAAERKAAEAAERKAAEAAERKAAEAAERKAAEAAERKAAEAAERKAPDTDRKTAEAAERKAADAERKAAEAAARKAAEAERKAAERKAEAERKAAEAIAAGPSDEADTASAEPEPENTTPVVPREALVYAEVGPSGVWSPGNNRLGPTLDALISVRFRPNQTSSIALVGMIPLLKTNPQTPDGATVEVNTYAIGGFGDLHLPLGQVELSAGLGALALLSSVSVSSTDPNSLAYVSSYKTQRLAALLGRAGASYAITRDLRVSASVMAGLTVKELQISFPRSPGDGEDSMNKPDVTWGRPLLLIGTLSIELALPWDR